MLPEPPMQLPGQGLGLRLRQGVERVKLMADSLWKYLKKKFIRYSRLLHLNDEVATICAYIHATYYTFC